MYGLAFKVTLSDSEHKVTAKKVNQYVLKVESDFRLTAHFDALVRAVLTVRFTIALPSLGNALSAATDEVHLGTGLPH